MVMLKQQIKTFTVTHPQHTGHSYTEYNLNHNMGRYPSVMTCVHGVSGDPESVRTVDQDVTPSETRGFYGLRSNENTHIVRLFRISSLSQEVKVRLVFD